MQQSLTWLLVDGFNIAYRSFYAMPELARSDGFLTQALHGWIRVLGKLAEIEQPTHTVVFFDLGGSDARLAIHPEYKAQRPDMPDGLAEQLPEIKRLCDYLGYHVVEEAGVEADDLLAAMALQYVAKGEGVALVSADKDFAQLLRPGLIQLIPPPTANPKLGWQRLDSEGVVKKWGITPEQMVDYLALMGDASDNIPGIPGVGPKTASQWLQIFGSIDSLLTHLPQVKPERFQKLLEEFTPRLRLNQELIRLNTTRPIPTLTPAALQKQALFDFLTSMEMHHTLALLQRKYGNKIDIHIPTQSELF